MSMKRILCLVLALVLCGSLAFAEETDLQTQLDEANARIAELEAEVELYKPYYDAQVVATYDGGVVFRDEAMEVYQQYEDYFSSNYGISLSDYGMDTQYKQYAVQMLVEDKILAAKAAELGLDQIDDETLTSLNEQAATSYESYIQSVISYFSGDDVSEEDARQSSIDYLESLGYTQDAILESLKESYIDNAVYDYVTADVTVSDEEVQTAYDELVSSQESSFTSDSTYNSSRNNGDLIVWNPEGYRAVKHVLIKFTDDQATKYDELTSTLESLNTELEAAQAPAEDTTEETTEETSSEETEEATRTVEEIQADIDAAQAELDALYEELMPKAEEVVQKFNEGTSFADLITEYNEDPGMQNEPTATNGYAVAAESTAWDPAFTAGAMSIASVGEISEPVKGQNGIHIIYYEADITPGAVDLETIREDVEASALSDKVSDTYNTTVDSWIEAANVTYYYDNM